MSAKRYALLIDSKKCLNCKACVVTCRAEYHVPLEHSRNRINEEHRGTWPDLAATFEPEQCHHCANPSCVRVCPTGASYQRDDGIVLIREEDCIGCRYCMIACPYEARFFREDKGVVEKCTLCVGRLDRGKQPACVETCPSKARMVGDVTDPNSEVFKILATRESHVKKPQTGNSPQIYYLS